MFVMEDNDVEIMLYPINVIANSVTLLGLANRPSTRVGNRVLQLQSARYPKRDRNDNRHTVRLELTANHMSALSYFK